MKDAGRPAYIDNGGAVTLTGKMNSQLPDAFFIRAVRQAEKEVTFSLADIAAVERSGCLNFRVRWERSC